MKLVRYLLPLAASIALSACSKPESTSSEPAVEEPPPVTEKVVTEIEVVEIEAGLSMRMLNKGHGAVAEAGNVAVVHYTGWLYDPTQPDNRGTKFDSSVDRGEYFPFPLGARKVILGWDRGVAGMMVGERRELTIAPELAYGDRDLGIIPPGSTLVFEVDLIDLEIPGSAAPAQE
jgi:FKBP-type peptidyl-prolyl cis-trans isomerase